MMLRTKVGQRLSRTILPLALLGAAVLLAGCRVSENDVTRWGSTEHGPDKLVQVVTHDKYDWSLRVEAGLELIRMKPRNGRRVGINRLVDAVAMMGVEDRQKFLGGFTPGLVEGIRLPTKSDGVDPSIPFKDGAMALLTYEKAALISDEAVRKQVVDALIGWSLGDFDRRLENTTQMFGMEQLVRAIGAPSVKGFPALITQDSTKFDRIAGLVADFGDQATKEAAGQKLVELAKYTSSSQWVAKTKPIVDEANKASKLTPTPEQFQAQISQYQDEALTKVFASLKKIGTRACVEYCLSMGVDKAQNAKRRTAALAAVEGRLDRNSTSDVEKILAIAAADDTPDEVRDIAFQRAGEMPRDQVVGKLYGLFGAKKWKVRWVAAETVLKMSSTDQLPEFMSKLPPGPANGFALAEPLKYGDAIEKLAVKNNKKPRDAVLPFLTDKALAPRLTAIGYFYANGHAADIAVLNDLTGDKAATPKVDDADGKWQCEVAKADGKETEVKDIKTVGQFVSLCVTPAMKAR
jgi:hypothetical protein